MNARQAMILAKRVAKQNQRTYVVMLTPDKQFYVLSWREYIAGIYSEKEYQYSMSEDGFIDYDRE